MNQVGQAIPIDIDSKQAPVAGQVRGTCCTARARLQNPFPAGERGSEDGQLQFAAIVVRVYEIDATITVNIHRK